MSTVLRHEKMGRKILFFEKLKIFLLYFMDAITLEKYLGRNLRVKMVFWDATYSQSQFFNPYYTGRLSLIYENFVQLQKVAIYE